MTEKIEKLSHLEIKSKRPAAHEITDENRMPVVVIAENIRSLYNVGAIFRTSDGACIEKLNLCGYTGFPPRKEIDKTALGSVESVVWEHSENTIEVVKSYIEKGYKIVSLEHTDRSISYLDMKVGVNFDFPICLIVGNEVSGISEDLVGLSDMAIEIPMYGLKQSLNVSVAFGILIYHLRSLYEESRE